MMITRINLDHKNPFAAPPPDHSTAKRANRSPRKRSILTQILWGIVFVPMTFVWTNFVLFCFQLLAYAATPRKPIHPESSREHADIDFDLFVQIPVVLTLIAALCWMPLFRGKVDRLVFCLLVIATLVLVWEGHEHTMSRMYSGKF